MDRTRRRYRDGDRHAGSDRLGDERASRLWRGPPPSRSHRTVAGRLGDQELSSLEDAVAALERSDGVAVIPTDTVYGLVARMDRPDAIQRVFEIKGRSEEKALQILVPSDDWLVRLGRPSEVARKLARRYWPGPLTIVIEAGENVPAPLTQGGRIGMRSPAHPLAQEVIVRSGVLAATSANRSGETTPLDVASIRSLFGDNVDVYVDGGRIETRASTVVDVTETSAVVKREGAIPREEILRALEFGFEAE